MQETGRDTLWGGGLSGTWRCAVASGVSPRNSVFPPQEGASGRDSVCLNGGGPKGSVVVDRGASMRAREGVRGRRALIGAGALLIASSSAADDANYHPYPVGGRAFGLGGAFTAIADDLGGVVRNPAGLVDVGRSVVNLSSNLYGIQYNDNPLTNIGRLESLFAELQIIPSAVGYVSTLRENGGEQAARHAYGIGLFAPSFRRINVRSQGTSNGGAADRCGGELYEHDLWDQLFQGAVSYAYRVDDSLRFGATGLATVRVLRDREATTCYSVPSTALARVAHLQTDLRLVVLNLSWIVGAKFELGPGWYGGVAVETPGLRLLRQADLRVQRFLLDEGESADDLGAESVGGVSADHRLPTRLRFGVAYVRPERATYSLDVTVHAPTRYQLLSGPANRLPQTLVTEIRRRAVVNLNVGAEWLLVPSRFSLAVGAFTDFSSVPASPTGGTLTRPQLRRVSHIGATVTAGLFGRHTLTRIGLLGSYGAGFDVIPEARRLAALPGSDRFREVRVRDGQILFFVSTAFRYWRDAPGAR